MAVSRTPTGRRLGRLVEVAHLAPRRPDDTDRDLLTAFRDRHDQAAFAELVRRHGGLVRAVCRRVLGPHPAVDDTWQATFLVLARRAAGLGRVGSLAGWLHGVAYRTALNARRADRRRAAHEARGRPAAPEPPDKPAIWRELQELVDAEVRRLPGPDREVFVRCCLQDGGCREVARELGLNEGTVRSRLARARRLLRGRLERRGVCLSALVALATVVADPVPPALARAAADAAGRVAAGASVAGLVPPTVLVLAGRTGAALARRIAVAVTVAAGLVGVMLAQLPAKPADAPPAAGLGAEFVSRDTDALPDGALARFGTLRFRPGTSVTALAFSPDGKRLGCWGQSEEDRFTLWDAGTGKEVWSTATKRGSLLTLAWLADGRGLGVVMKNERYTANGSFIPDLRVWDFTAARPGPLERPGERGMFALALGQDDPGRSHDAAALSPDGTRLAVATRSGPQPEAVEIFEARPAETVTGLKKLASFDPPPVRCRALAYTPDGTHLIGLCRKEEGVSSADTTVVVWGADGKIARTIAGPGVTSTGGRFTWAVSNGAAAVGLEDGATVLLDLRAGTRRTLPTGHQGGTFAVAVSPDGRTLATAGRDGKVRLVDVAAGKVLRVLGTHFSWTEAIAFSPDGKRVASGGQDGVIRVWDAAAGGEAVATGGHAYRVWRADISADGKTVLTDGGDRLLRVWEPATGAERRRIDPGASVTHARLSPDGKHVVALVGEWKSVDRSVKVWDAATGADASPPGFPKALPASGFRFTPDGAMLLTHHDDHLAAYAWPAGTKRWAVEMPKPVKSPGISRVDSIAVAPDGRHFAVVAGRYWYRDDKSGLRFASAAEGVVDVFESATGRLVRRLVESGSIFRAGTFTPDGLFLHNGSGTFPGDVREGKPRESRAGLCVVDPLTGRLVREFDKSGRADSADSGYTVALSADGKVLFKATGIGEVQAFEVATGKFRSAFVGHRDYVFAVSTPTDVRRMLSGSGDTTALLWDVGFGGKRGAKLSALARSQMWDALASDDKAGGYDAMTTLAGDPTGFLELAATELKPAAAGPTAAELAPIFRDLDARAFATREAAAAKLDRYGESALALVRAELEKGPSAEVRERLERFVDRCDGSTTFPDRLRSGRAIELLEHLGTPEARALLTKLAAGGPSRRTTDAAGAIKRLAGR